MSSTHLEERQICVCELWQIDVIDSTQNQNVLTLFQKVALELPCSGEDGLDGTHTEVIVNLCKAE